MLEVCQPYPTTVKRTHPDAGPMAFRAMGVGHHGSIPNSNLTIEIPGGWYRLLHQVGGSRSIGHYHGEKCAKLHMEEHYL